MRLYLRLKKALQRCGAKVKWLKWPKWLENKEYAKTAIFLIIILVGVFGFQLGVRAALRTSYPLAAVESESMVPTLNVGDIIIVRGISNASEEIKVGNNPEGDIIVFYDPRGYTRRVYWFFSEPALIVHRAIEKKYEGGKLYFRTKGDANSVDDLSMFGWIPETKVVGKVVGHIPWLGNISLFMQSDSGMFLIIMLFCVLLIWTIFFPEKESLKSEEKTSLYKEPS
jgi:signal peptidase